MGEAKRRHQLGRAAADQLLRRVRAGAFGPDVPATGYLFVLDKSPRGRDLLAVLKAVAADFAHLSVLLEGEALRLWEVSPLFNHVVLRGGAGSPAQRSALAANVDRLLSETLPRAAEALQASHLPWSWEVALEADAEATVRALLSRRTP